MSAALLLLGLATCASTMLGGLLALRLKDKLHLVLGFSAGAVIGVAFFEIIPESINLSAGRFEGSVVTSVMGLGFVAYLVLDRVIVLHAHQDGEAMQLLPAVQDRGRLGASSLSLHSFLDGIAIGFAFKVSPAVGAVVASAVLAHDFSDGINTVNLIVKDGGDARDALRWLAVDAIAPVLGLLASVLFSVSQSSLGLLLAVFAGTFTYIGAAELVPESHHAHPKFMTTAMTVSGMLVIFAVVRIAG
ncbi:MAG: ZIP family metal transporter [Dehalococcoidia bacterium]|nr:ZIP family metal transporter [Dehalococcoidia bacterium]